MLEVGSLAFRSLRQRGIERRQKLVDELVRSGYGVIDDPRICRRGEIILNRGLNSPNSNYCVVMKTSRFGITRVMFADLSKGEGGRALSRRELIHMHSSFRVSKAWADKVREDVLRTAQVKDLDARFVVMHGHWGKNKGKDDGASCPRKIVREMLFWGYDVDGTGYHNHVIESFLREITELERACGILKVPSIELTLPRSNPDNSNGDHMNVHFRDIEAALQLYGITEPRLTRIFPGMAPVMERSDLLKTVEEMREGDELSFSAPHTYAETQLGRQSLKMGVLNELEVGETLPWIFDFIRDNVDLVAIYNPTFSHRVVKFDENRLVPEAFFRDIVGTYVGSTAKLTQENITYAFAMYCKHNFGKRIYFDHDSHVYAGVPWLAWHVRMGGPLSYGRTVIHFTEREKARAAFARKDFTAADFVQVLRHGHFTRDGITINAKVSYDAFLELRKGKLLPAKARRSFLYGLAVIWDRIRQYRQYLSMLHDERKRLAENMVH